VDLPYPLRKLCYGFSLNNIKAFSEFQIFAILLVSTMLQTYSAPGALEADGGEALDLDDCK
jgi:hypothetical protein